MATSGTVKTNVTYDSYFWVKWSQKGNQDIAKNQTVIDWSCGVYCGHNFYSNAVKMSAVTINGTKVYAGGTYSNYYTGDHTIASGTLTITHTDNGSKTFSIAAFTGWLYSSNNYSAAATNHTLNTIPRAGSIDSVVGNTDYLDGVFTYKYTPKSNVFYNRLRVSIPNVVALQTVNLGQKAASQQTGTYTLSTALLESIYNRYPNASTCELGFVIETYSDSGYSSKVGESVELTLKKTFPLTVAPKIENIAWTKTSNEPATWPMTQNVSQGRMSMTGVSEAYGSRIVSYSLTFAGFSSSEPYLGVDNIASPGTLKAIAKVTDTRGRPATKEVEFIVSAYEKPKLTVTAFRSDASGVEDPGGEYLCVKATATATAVGDNAIQSVTLQYKQRSASSYTSVALTSGTSKVVAASSNYTWDWAISAADKVNTVSINGSIATGAVVLDILSTGKGIGLGKVAEREGLDSAWDFMKDGTAQSNFVIEQGTSGYWFYRKWLSGRAEAWTTSEISFTQTPSAILGGYYTSGQIDLPSKVFSTSPNCIASGRIGTGLGFASISTVSPTMVSLGVFGNQNATTSYITSIYAMGRWK